MKVKPIYQEGETIDIYSYLNKHGIDDVEEYIDGGSKGIEPPNNYNNMEEGYGLLKEIIDER